MKYFFLNYEYTYKYKIKRFQAWINVYQISLSASIKSKLWKKNLEKVQKFKYFDYWNDGKKIGKQKKIKKWNWQNNRRELLMMIFIAC